jgi:hypothetical protein
MKVEPPPLANYLSVVDYIPQYGDYVIWCKWFTTWHGTVTYFDVDKSEVSIIFEGTPFLLFTLDELKHEKYTRKIKLSKIRSSLKGSWAVLRHDTQRNVTIWHI